MLYNILVLEDDLTQASFLTQTIREFSPDIHPVHSASYDTALQLISSDLNFHAFFLDISLDLFSNPTDETENVNEDGLRLAHFLQTSEKYKNTPVVFLTGHVEYLRQALNQHHCFAFLLKPYTAGDVHQQLRDIFYQKNASLLVRNTDGIYITVPFDQILYIRSEGRYLTFTLQNDAFVSRQYTLRKLSTLLPAEFIHCHRSYIVNQQHVQSYDFPHHQLTMKFNGKIIPLRRDITHIGGGGGLK